MAELQGGYRSIDACIDSLAQRTDCMSECIDHQNTRLDGDEEWISKLENDSSLSTKGLEKIPKTVMAKNKDLEARFSCSNIRIMGVVESTAMDRPDPFVVKLLKDLFVKNSFLSTFVVDQAHLSLLHNPTHSPLPSPTPPG
ncbi:hypothetical protein NDU88_009361 [Pleurodeles waltl]|uniref:Uncharacterized protein n=1 Tax=Pleurodeles waltl TaxID=8319 RepID=A0AAV7PS03_PLEWA|nr:hypothetical protein NDU88_009361 [Pleurodeles waltl]